MGKILKVATLMLQLFVEPYQTIGVKREGRFRFTWSAIWKPKIPFECIFCSVGLWKIACSRVLTIDVFKEEEIS